MTGRILFVGLAIVTTSCGILGIYHDDTNYDPDFQAQAIAEINRRPIARELDSLIAKIDSAQSIIPNGIEQTILIVETYKYSDYLKIQANKFRIPQDTEKERKRFNRYEIQKKNLIKDPKYKIIYIDKGEYDGLDKYKYRYVLRTTNRIEYDPGKLIVTSDGHVYPFVQTPIYYICDRQTSEVFGDIKDLKQLSKK